MAGDDVFRKRVNDNSGSRFCYVDFRYSPRLCLLPYLALKVISLSGGRVTGALTGAAGLASGLADEALGAFLGLESDMDTTENKKRVLDLLWRNYETQVGATKRYADRVTIVLGATIGAIGLTVKFSDADLLGTDSAVISAGVCLVAIVLAFVFAGVAWYPKLSEQPSGTDVDRIWRFLVAVDDDGSAATVMGDLCKVTRSEREATRRIARLFTACMVCCGVALVSAIICEMLSSA